MCRTTGLSVLATDADGFDHSMVVQVKDPHNLESSCPAGVSPCLADGSLSIVLDGNEALLGPGSLAKTLKSRRSTSQAPAVRLALKRFATSA